MLTPQEVSEQAFSKVSFGGYHMSQVDEFLDVLTKDYATLYSENTLLKSKMKVLVDKVEEYRSTEDAMRRALMSAQRMADNMVKEAEQKRADKLREAEEELAHRKAEIAEEIRAEEYRLAQAQQATAAFVAQVRALHEKQEALLGGLKDLVPEAVVVSEAERVQKTVDDIENSVQRLLAEEQPAGEDTTELPAVDAQSAESEPADPSATLRFGRDYEIKQ